MSHINIAADIKQTLYAILGKKKIGKPNYQFLQENSRAGGRYRCQCTVDGLNYIGYGCSRNKKDAQTNAARDYGEYLLREGLVTPAELPQLQLQPSDLAMAPSQPVDVPGIEQPTSSLPYHSEGQPPQQEGQQLLDDFAADGSEPPSFFAKPQIPPMSAHDLYVEQKAEQVAQSEAVDMTAEIHGGWTLENCKQALNEYCQKKRLPPRDYKITKTGTDHASTVIAENELFLPHLNRSINGRGQGSNQKMAITSCALSLVRQLFHIGDIPPVSGVQAARGQKQTADNLSEIKVQIEPHLATRIEQYLATVGVQPALDGIDSASAQNPCSLLIDQKLAEFTSAEQNAFSSTIVWAPPSQNWNAWKASNIDNQPIAFWPMEQISTDLLNQENKKVISERIFQSRRSLPVFQHREEIIRSIADNPVVLIKGSTGCGKSTQICQYLLESHVSGNRGANFNCFITQPRRISAITLAERIAVERGEQLGESVGYSVRFEGCTPRPYGAIMFVTVGVLMRKMEMGLRGISHVIIDEIHERDINTDFILIVIRDMIRTHPKLRVVLMSATIDTSMFTEYFGQCPIIEIQQRVHPVQHFFLEDTIGMLKYMPSMPVESAKKKKKRKKTASSEEGGTKDEEEEGGEDSMALSENLLVCAENYHPMVKQALERMNEKEIPIELIEILLTDIDQNGKSGAVLIFLPGWNMISLLWNRLMLHPIFSNNNRFVILPLHSQLSAREQHRVFEPVGPDQRKIILSTNIAETSVTIDDVVFVIDSCRVREKMYTSRNNLVHFANVWASRTNLVQRRGRAGRVQEGFCFHLITKARFEALEEHRTPEMLRTPLHEITLTIKLLRLGSVGKFLEKAVQPPPVDAVVEAEVLLREMNALDKFLELTDLGRILARLPIEPKLGKMVLLGAALGIGDLMLTSAAATSFNSPFVPKEKMHTKLSHMHRSFSGNRPSDHIGLVNCNQQFEQELEIDESAVDTFCRRYSLSYPLLNMTREAKRQLYEVLTKICSFPESAFIPYPINVHGSDPKLDLFLSMLVAAYYPNICYIRDRRRVFTLERAVALLSNMSVCVPFNRGEQPNFPSPLFMFTEKVKVLDESNYVQSTKPSWIDQFADLSLLSKFQLRTSCISCKQCSMISPIQLLLFGSRRVDAIGPNKVQLDKMIPLDMSAKLAAQIVALRPCLDALIVRTCTHPEQLAEQPENDKILAELICELSSENGWLPTGEEGLAPIEGTSGQGQSSSQPKMEYRYNVAEQNSYTMAQRPDLSLPQPFHLHRSPSRKRPFGAPPPFLPTYGYGDRPMPIPFPPNPAGTEAIAAATGLAEMAAAANAVPFEQRDFSSMAGYGPSNYFGSGRPEAMIPQHRHLHQNGGPVFQGTFPKGSKRGGGGRGRGRGAGRGRGYF